MMRHAQAHAFLALAFTVLVVQGCSSTSQSTGATGATGTEEYLVAKVEPTQGNTAKGEVRFYRADAGVRVVADLEGLAPGPHGFHLHEKGDCSAPDAASAGSHYNPSGAPHGSPDSSATARHMGDLGNVEAGADGKANYDRTVLLSYENLRGLSVLVHASPDDFTTQPSGNSGARIGCGVIAAND
jgi:superoxide dismutase, Cu-Zn family